MTTIRIGSTVMLAAVVFLAAGCGRAVSASVRETAAPGAETSRLGAIDQGFAVTSAGRAHGLGAGIQGIHLCPPGFWRLYRLSVSGGRRHTPALFPFPVGCGAAMRAGTVPALPAAAPLPLVTSPG